MTERIQELANKAMREFKYIDKMDYISGDSAGEQYYMTTKTGITELWEIRENKHTGHITAWELNEDTNVWDYKGVL